MTPSEEKLREALLRVKEYIDQARQDESRVVQFVLNGDTVSKIESALSLPLSEERTVDHYISRIHQVFAADNDDRVTRSIVRTILDEFSDSKNATQSHSLQVLKGALERIRYIIEKSSDGEHELRVDWQIANSSLQSLGKER